MTAAIEQSLAELIQAIGRRYGIEKIVLFGSRARGDNKYNSDIDLAVFPPCGSFKDFGMLCADIEDLPTLLKFDVVLVDANLDKRLIENISNEGVVLYEHTEK